jgi:hypothetical protein
LILSSSPSLAVKSWQELWLKIKDVSQSGGLHGRSGVVVSDYLRAMLVSRQTGVNQQNQMAGIYLTLKEGYYFLAEEFTLDFAKSENVGNVNWFGYRDKYQGKIILPLNINFLSANLGAKINLNLQIKVCKTPKNCHPQKISLKLELPHSLVAIDSAYAFELDMLRRQVFKGMPNIKYPVCEITK